MMLGSENGRLINYPNRNCSINELQVNPSLFFWILDEKQQRFEMCWDVWGSKRRKTSYRGIPLWMVRRGHSSMILPAPCKLGCAGGPCLVKLWRTMALGLAEESFLLEDVQGKCCTTLICIYPKRRVAWIVPFIQFSEYLNLNLSLAYR